MILSYDDVQLRLSVRAAGKVYDARGSLYLSNKRVRGVFPSISISLLLSQIVFLSPAHETLKSLSVLLHYLADGYLAQPLLGANRWEASILPCNSSDEQDQDTTMSSTDATNHSITILTHGADLKVWFNNGSTFEWYQGVEEARERLGSYSNAPQNEPLPKYESTDVQNPSPADYPNDDSVEAAMTARDADADATEERQQYQENPPPYD